MKWKKAGLKFGVIFLAIIAGFLAGLIPGIPAGEGQMLAAGAIVLGYALLGAFITLIIAVLAIRGRDDDTLIRFILGLLLLGAVLLLFVRKVSRESRERREAIRNSAYGDMHAPNGEDVSARFQGGPYYTVDQRCNSAPDRSGPAGPESIRGLGFVRVPFGRKGLHLKWSAQSQYGAPAVDSLVYAFENGRFILRYAPPYLQPYQLKPDYQLLYLRAESISRFTIEVALNEDGTRKGWVARDAVDWLPWPDFLLERETVRIIDGLAGPYVRPFLRSDRIRPEIAANETIRIVSIGPEWAEVTIGTEAAVDKRRRAWLKWREKDRLLVGW